MPFCAPLAPGVPGTWTRALYLVNHPVLPLRYRLPAVPLEVCGLEELVREEHGPVLPLPDVVTDPPVRTHQINILQIEG